MLTKRELDILSSDWEKVELIEEQAATLLYDRLFALDPTVRALFPADMQTQKVKLLRMIGAAVYGITQPEVLAPIVEHLGRKHVRFGVQNEHYATVGAALIWALRRGNGPAFSPEHEAAWTKAYAYLSETMKPPA